MSLTKKKKKKKNAASVEGLQRRGEFSLCFSRFIEWIRCRTPNRTGHASFVYFPCSDIPEYSRPLFKPCKCSGSIGLTHQDCLQSWLQVQRGNGTCELCKTPFRFSPQYAPHAPERLPFIKIVIGLSKRLLARWLPLVFRVLFAASLWLLVAPLVTAYLYHGWMNRPSAIIDRLSWKLLTMDLISGAVVSAYIIISFLSLMSFADFLRVEWQQRGFGPGEPRRLQQQRQQEQQQNDARMARPREDDIDNGVWLQFQQTIVSKPRGGWRPIRDSVDPQPFQDADGGFLQNDREPVDEDDDPLNDFLYDRPINAEDSSDDEEFVEHAELPLQEGQQFDELRQRMEDRPDRPFPFDQDEPVDVDINIALDELLGVRGPLTAVVRNLLWLLAFNAVYIGFFCFVPRTVGSAVSALVFNVTEWQEGFNSTSAYETLNSTLSISMILRTVDYESVRQQAVFRLHDFVTVTLGYLTFAFAAWTGCALWNVAQNMGYVRHGRQAGNNEAEEGRDGIDDMHQLVNGHVHDAPVIDEQAGVALGLAIGVALDAMMAIVKVGVLLFLKMFVLPVVLGVCLDGSLGSLFGCSLYERMSYAGRDLFSFVLLHWVFGITFMLLVTVSVLQLREVVHPELLSQVIRPQEPQPDLLGNLLHESVSTHTKRMAVSFIIYAVLWILHIYIPARLLAAVGVTRFLKFLELRFCYFITPQLQIPFELLLFHLCMLGLLERYKNGLGEMQHYWLKLMTGLLGLQDGILPRKVDSFQYVGSRPIFKDERTVDGFWYDLAKGDQDRENFIENHLHDFERIQSMSQNEIVEGVTKDDGQRVLELGCDYIRLPMILPGRTLRTRSVLLPTKFGKYRLSRLESSAPDCLIHLWKEIPGSIIPRPPEGWDDLGVEPPDIQGRWAYGNEKKSVIEGGVARRRNIFGKNETCSKTILVSMKLFTLLFLSWIVTTIILFLTWVIPVGIGRAIHFILRVPEKWVHDPLAFATGFIFTFPAVTILARTIFQSDASVWRRIISWISLFSVPPLRKLGVLAYTGALWFFVCPFLLGILYEIVLIKPVDWFAGKDTHYSLDCFLSPWLTGTLLLYIWSFLCIRGVLTRRFRVLVFEGRDLQDNDNLPPQDTWQGEHGHMALFWNIWNSVWTNWEWDKVDRTVLLDNVAIPVARQLLYVTTTALCSLALSSWRLSNIPVVGQASAVRIIIILSSSIRIGRLWRDDLARWFEVAHKTARDDLYLIGEVLMNHNE